ncbi:MAG: helix-turn-helix transcriptional regulator [Actinomycetota bacterium]
MANDKAETPLTPAVLHILLTLATGERHGYGIMKQVQSDSRGKVKMGPGTLYGSLGRMIEAGLIRESDKKVDRELDDSRRVYYEISGAGRRALATELQRYRHVVTLGERKLSLPPFAYGHEDSDRTLQETLWATAPLLSDAIPGTVRRVDEADVQRPLQRTETTERGIVRPGA